MHQFICVRRLRRLLTSFSNPSKMRFLFALYFLAVVVCVFHDAEATYRKPPFNGSIFGKRGVVEYDSTGKAVSALCEIAAETCQAWYQTLENK